MKISLNWLKKYVKVPVTDEELVRLIGARLVEVEGVIDETHKYDSIYIVRVESCEKIPETHLSLCQINCGKSELVQVVCGAPNVREGMLAVWIAPGATVPASVKEDAPFVIGKRKMRGYESCGMLAGADELDFGDDHSGIVEIDPAEAKPGDLLADVFELNDKILDIENKSLTHRPDYFGIIGFAREVAGILNIDYCHNDVLDSDLKVDNNISIKIEEDGICERYSAIILEKHGELRKKYLTWADTVLSKSGMRPIEPIVDVTNYLMLLTGQPLHAFDYDKFVKVGKTEKPEVNVRLARKNEKLVLLDGKEIKLMPTDIVICSGDTPVALAGAMGGASTAIDENTRNIIIESATFSLYNLRKTQMEHGIFSEAITRFTKGLPAYQTLAVAEECAEMLADGFKVASVADEYPNPEKQSVVKITTDEINGLLGTEYSAGQMVKTLENVGFEVKKSGNELNVTAPAWRKDIHIKEDIIEEIGRLNGYDNILPTLPKHGTPNQNKMFALKKDVRDILAKFGANETLTYSFVSGNLLEKAGLNPKNSYRIVNSISPELQYVRQSIVPSLLDKAFVNQKLPVDKFALFEMNKVYRKEWGLNEENVPVEKNNLGFVIAERKNQGTAYYAAKYYVTKLLEEYNIEVEFLPIKIDSPANMFFEKKRGAEIWSGNVLIGFVGEFKNSVKHNFKLADYLAGFEINLDVVKELRKNKAVSSDFEIKKKEDVTIATTKTYAEVLAELMKKNPEAEITPLGIYQPYDSETKNMTFHLEYK